MSDVKRLHFDFDGELEECFEGTECSSNHYYSATDYDALRQQLERERTLATSFAEARDAIWQQLEAAQGEIWFMAPYEGHEGYVEGITWKQHAENALADLQDVEKERDAMKHRAEQAEGEVARLGQRIVEITEEYENNCHHKALLDKAEARVKELEAEAAADTKAQVLQDQVHHLQALLTEVTQQQEYRLVQTYVKENAELKAQLAAAEARVKWLEEGVELLKVEAHPNDRNNRAYETWLATEPREEE